MTNGDEVSITCGEAASIVDRIRGFFEPSSILVSTLVLTLRPTGLLPLVTDSLPVRLLPTELLSGTPIRSRDITLGDDPGINGQLWESAAYRYHGAAGDLGALDGARRPPAVVPY